MKDIARECKVSVATVSIALSGSAKKGRISESKLEEIRQTARRLNYFPNSSASNLARGRSQTIGVVINDIRNSHIAELDTAISEVLQERGYSVVNHIFNDKNEGRLDELIRRIASENLCALVWAKSMEPGKTEENRLLYEIVDSLGIPVFTMDGYGFQSDGLNICFDYEKAGYEATSYLAGCGHRRIGCIAGNPEYRVTQE
ncbi:MAG: LacI family DNA-binding transcriptional regulator, partial [Lachnospiraceae bacterium]